MSIEDSIRRLKARNYLPATTVARGRVVKKYPWFATLVMRLKLVEDASIQTLATDGVSIFINPEFFASLDEATKASAFAHETYHAALGHCDPRRMGKRDPGRWNIAADHVVNLLLEADGFVVPANWYCDSKYAGLSVEQVYRMIDPNEDAKNPDIRPYPDDANPQELNDEWTKAALQAAQAKQARQAFGTSPGGLSDTVRANLAPVVDWRAMLAQYLTQCTLSDTSWTRPNRRYIPHSLYMPGTISEGIRHVVIGIDTSGSVSSQMLGTFVSQIAPILASFPIERLSVYFVDTEIAKQFEDITADDLPSLEQVYGRGGTDFECLFAHTATHDDSPSIVIMFTDFECPMPDSARNTPYPILWVVPDRCGNPEFGPEYGVVIPAKFV